LRDRVEQLEERLRATQANVIRVRSVASAWAREPLFCRDKTRNPLPLKCNESHVEPATPTRVSKR
jgi:hypothetical protein